MAGPEMGQIKGSTMSTNDPIIEDSDVRILEDAILQAAEQFGVREFAMSLVELPAEAARKAA